MDICKTVSITVPCSWQDDSRLPGPEMCHMSITMFTRGRRCTLPWARCTPLHCFCKIHFNIIYTRAYTYTFRNWSLIFKFPDYVLNAFRISHKCATFFSDLFFFTYCPNRLFVGRDSVVRIDSLRAGRSAHRNPVGARFSAPVQTGPGAHPSLLYNGYRVFPVGKAAGGGWRWPLTPSSAKVKERVEPYIYPPLWAFVASYRDTKRLFGEEYKCSSHFAGFLCLLLLSLGSQYSLYYPSPKLSMCISRLGRDSDTDCYSVFR